MDEDAIKWWPLFLGKKSHELLQFIPVHSDLEENH